MKLCKQHISYILIISMIVGLLTGIVSPVHADEQSSPSTVIVRLSPTDDASVHNVNVNTNYASGTLILGAGRQFLMKFDLSGITDPITNATLKLYKTNTNSANFTVFRSVYDDWSESTVTYSSLPGDSTGEHLIDEACGGHSCVASGGSGTMIPIDLSNTVLSEMDGDKKLSLVFKRDNTAASKLKDMIFNIV
ncbi:DNRLRE domain-containing protein [Paenibacillus donghaensis]|uniref:Carbohydrate-binding module family 96 domain-containing protein n=1 Tax=Paenibacillus donghaensis TaxID=414771 RepID=A0A2Z2KNH7_9BACL|nr:DNRLRE domain-containing protein [Paenibacillus donghaensis]ASA21661.1 hypothetical protein B9T62_13295 [Paenibacillus donghaensis]